MNKVKGISYKEDGDKQILMYNPNNYEMVFNGVEEVKLKHDDRRLIKKHPRSSPFILMPQTHDQIKRKETLEQSYKTFVMQT